MRLKSFTFLCLFIMICSFAASAHAESSVYGIDGSTVFPDTPPSHFSEVGLDLDRFYSSIPLTGDELFAEIGLVFENGLPVYPCRTRTSIVIGCFNSSFELMRSDGYCRIPAAEQEDFLREASEYGITRVSFDAPHRNFYYERDGATGELYLSSWDEFDSSGSCKISGGRSGPNAPFTHFMKFNKFEISFDASGALTNYVSNGISNLNGVLDIVYARYSNEHILQSFHFPKTSGINWKPHTGWQDYRGTRLIHPPFGYANLQWMLDTCPPLMTTEQPSYCVPGDADGNGTATPQDALRILQYCAGWDIDFILSNCDINQDEICDVTDALLVLTP